MAKKKEIGTDWLYETTNKLKDPKKYQEELKKYEKAILNTTLVYLNRKYYKSSLISYL